MTKEKLTIGEILKNQTRENAKTLADAIEKYAPLETVVKHISNFFTSIAEAEKTSDKIIEMIERDAYANEFMRLPPLSGHDLLLTLTKMNERTIAKVQQIVSKGKSDAARKGHAKTQHIKVQFQQHFLEIRANEKASSEEPEKKAVIARHLIAHYRLKNPGTKDPATERTVIGWLSEVE